jgi:cytochrome c
MGEQHASRIRWRIAGAAALAAAALGLAALGGCREAHGGQPAHLVAGGNAGRGEQAIQKYGCGACHVIPGIDNAQGAVGPPLIGFGRRTYIAGEVANTPENLVHWIEVPQSIEPGTAMPNMGITEGEARDIAAYLYTLR